MVIEARVEHRFCALVREAGGVAVKMYMRDWPDRLVLFPNEKMFFCELKRPGEKPRPGQVRNHAMLRSMGYDVWNVDGSDWAGTQALIEQYAPT